MTLLDPEAASRPIESLVGTTLNDRWKVIDLIVRQPVQTGSVFSVGYEVEDKDGSRAFAKVLDFSRALQDADTAKALNEMTQTYIFERSLLELCGKHGLSRIVRGLDYGELPRSDVPLGKLFFIVFELADGDIRRYMSNNSKAFLSWRLNILHDIAVGLNQLHGKNISHQDLKPSNVLIFETEDVAKLADLGRAYCGTLTAPHDGFRRPGAFYYAPPEQIYEHHFEDRLAYRLTGDLYLLGSMLDFFVANRPTTVGLIESLADVHRPFAVNHNGWRGYFNDVLPHLQDAHSNLVSIFHKNVRALLGNGHDCEKLAGDITSYYVYLTNPDPMKRGHPTARGFKHGSPYDLQRFISAFEILSKKLALSEKTTSCNPRPLS